MSWLWKDGPFHKMKRLKHLPAERRTDSSLRCPNAWTQSSHSYKVAWSSFNRSSSTKVTSVLLICSLCREVISGGPELIRTLSTSRRASYPGCQLQQMKPEKYHYTPGNDQPHLGRGSI
jgi:hypothetical protein